MKIIFKIDCGLYPLGLFTILSGIGLLHYIIGIGFTLLMLAHGAKRIRVIKKAVFPNHRR